MEAQGQLEAPLLVHSLVEERQEFFSLAEPR